MTSIRRTIVGLISSLALVVTARAAAPEISIIPVSADSFAIVDAGGSLFKINVTAWGANWGWIGWSEPAKVTPQPGHKILTTKLKSGATLALDLAVRLESPTRLVIETELRSDNDADLTLACLSLAPVKSRFTGGRLVVTKADGGRAEISFPIGKNNPGASVATLAFTPTKGGPVTFQLTPAATVEADGEARLVLAKDKITAGEVRKQNVTIELPGEAVYYPTVASVPSDEPGIADWYPFQPNVAAQGADELSLASWLDAPAGKLGRITSRGDELIYGGKPIKLWGLNDTYDPGCAPTKEMADKRAAFYARHGINAVRLHKYACGTGWEGIQSSNSCVALDAAALDRMDYFIAKLKARGIFVKLSPVFMMKLGSDDRAAVPYMNEFEAGPPPSPLPKDYRVNTKNGSIYLGRELQDLLIKQTSALLSHRNPYTKLTYAEDPAIAIVEMFNEDSALFYGTMETLKKVPTLRARAAQRFTRWLKERYKTEAAFRAAWGDKALNGMSGFTGESWADETIVPAGNGWFFDPAQLAGQMSPQKQRLLDTMRFLYELQNEFYDRYAAAIRAAGYQGELISANWYCGSVLGEMWNLHSDARFGLVDRHNYFTGIGNSMLPRPGSGILSSGLYQVANRPFMLSEWIHEFPNEFGAEGVVIISAYGMGLQGWDASFMFQNDDNGGYRENLGAPFAVTAPQILGLFPAVSRQVLRGDVKTSALTTTRYVHLPSLERGEIGFDNRTTAQGDIKTTDSTQVPAETLAVARTLTEFADKPTPTATFDPLKFRKDGVFTSSTGQLRWKPSADARGGWFTINTPATAAVVGYAAGERIELDTATIEPATPFAAIYLTAQEANATLADTKGAIITLMARARNTAQKIVANEFLLTKGAPPILLEPVHATLMLKRPGNPTVHILDQTGRRTGRTVPVQNGRVLLDSGSDRSPYYLVTW